MQRVLIVDDERLVADTLTLVFEKSGFEVATAYAADEALGIARKIAPDLLLCDIAMPGKNGLMLMQEMRQEFPACRVLFLTGLQGNLKAVHDQVRRSPDSVRVLMKPCEPEQLLRDASALLNAP